MIASNFFQERPVNQIVFHSRIRQHCIQFSGDPVNSVQMMAHGCPERALDRVKRDLGVHKELRETKFAPRVRRP